MILVSIILLFSALALGLLALLERYDAMLDKAHVDRQSSHPVKQVYYDAFTDHRQAVANPDDSHLRA